MDTYQQVYAAIPLLDELENLPELLECLHGQEGVAAHVVFCVNQPDHWHDDPDRRALCERNALSMAYIRERCRLPFTLIDRSSAGNGWKGKDHGVGMARKTAMDEAARLAGPKGVIISLDGDTFYDASYFRSVLENFNRHPGATGLAVPYYHRLTASPAEDRAILRYEIYMRNYSINLWRTANPYCFTALGSAMAVPVKAYRAIGGMSPKKSGEDFYFLQKLRKYGPLLTWNREKVYPAARFSDRVFFGTGPAMIRGAAGDWDSYPLYHYSFFDDLARTYEAFAALFKKDVPVPMDDFLSEVLKIKDPWGPLRKNARTAEQFVRACRDRIDGLRILQFLKYSQKLSGYPDEECLIENLRKHYPAIAGRLDFLREGFTFDGTDVASLDQLRNELAAIEEEYQQKAHADA
jgi:hypothetical protein